MRQLSIILAVMVSLCATAKTYSVKEIPNVQKADSTRLFSNPDGIVSPSVQAKIDSLLVDIRRQTSAEVAVVAVDDIDTDDIDAYATQLFREWGIGKKDNNNGMLILVAKDSHNAVIRTGYGMEGVMPDILTGRIREDIMYPRFREDDFDGGLLLGVKETHRLLTDPAAAAELTARLEDQSVQEMRTVLGSYFGIGVALAVVLLLYMLYKLNAMKTLSPYEKYIKTDGMMLMFWVLTALFLGGPLIAALPLALMRNRWRNHPRKCPKCGTAMKKLDEATDNQYLSPSQDLEERLNSVDYDVWLCPKCGVTEKHSFVKNKSIYKECVNCHARTLKLDGVRTLTPATTVRTGVGEKTYVCLNCHKKYAKKYTIPKVVPAVTAGDIRGASGVRSSGGSFGGGFGGGLTGGGGSSGRW